MATRIEIDKLHNDFYEIRVGDITGSSTHSNISKKELISELIDEVDKLKYDANEVKDE